MGQEKTPQEIFDATLAPYAARHDNSKGRKHAEPSAADRNEFERDSSRIIHSTGFRKLQYKTQVFTNEAGDLFRTRATHSLEVSQVARATARALRLNESLAETLALAHDLGHAPFGHLGQDALHELMREHGGFEHNLQALRMVDELERPYLAWPGLNLLFEAREGILKHCSANNARILGDIADRFLPEDERKNPNYRAPSLEAQITDVCDAIAYTHADLEDAVIMGILTLEQAEAGLPLFAQAMKELKAKHGAPKKGDEARFAKVATGMTMKKALNDLIETTKKALEDHGIKSIEMVRAHPKLARLSKEFADNYHVPFKRFLKQEVYEHPDVERWRVQQKHIIQELFAAYEKHPKWMEGYSSKDSRGLHRQICDYIAGMTDRYATQEFNRVKELLDKKSVMGAMGMKR